MNNDDAVGEVVVHAHGDTSAAERAYAKDKIAHLVSLPPAPVLYGKVDLVAHADPARERPAFAKAELDVNGQVVRAHATGSTMFEAIDFLEARLRRRIERSAHLQEARHLRHRDDGHDWQRGDPTDHRPSYFPRPVEDRDVIRRKTFAMDDLTVDEAALALEQLDHDFYLFRNLATGEDNVLHRVGDGRYELLEPSPSGSGNDATGAVSTSPVRPSTTTLDDATELLDAGDLAFVFFVDPVTSRGSVVYRRYDGHYGLVTATSNA
jgi:ribosome-associated translation inhibitor RaiA